MLGDKLGVLKGKVTGQRILPSGAAPSLETTFEVSGEFAGVASPGSGRIGQSSDPMARCTASARTRGSS